LVANLVRLVLALLIAVTLLVDGPLAMLYVLALVTLSVNRFLLATMTAGLPRVVEPGQLLAANSIQPTLGTIAAAVGAAVGGLVTVVVPSASDLSLALWALVAAAIAFGASSWVTLLIGRTDLGPERPLEALNFGRQVRELTHELADGVRYLHARVTPFHALGIMAAQRLLYGVMFVAAILISRHLLGDPERPQEAIGKFTIVLMFAAVGFGLAALVTPMLKDRVPRHSWVVICLVVGAAGQTMLASTSQVWGLFIAAVVVSFAVQGGKIAVDTIVQRDTDDSVRGRAFTLYDMAFNVAFIGAALVAGLVLPDKGYSRPVMIALVAAYLILAAVYSRAPRAAASAPAPRPSS
jgi:predicted MFS family arabinose efflux permease